MSGTLRIPQYAQAGDYWITVLLRDVVGNTVRYEHADELFGLNFHASSSQTDTAAPRVTGLSLGQYEINVSGTSRDVDVAVSFSDNLSGVASATAWLIGPDGNVVAGNRHAVMAKLGATTGVLAAAAFHKSVAGIAHDASDRIIYDTDNGCLYYDPDGNGAAKAILLATLSTKLALTAADFVVI